MPTSTAPVPRAAALNQQLPEEAADQQLPPGNEPQSSGPEDPTHTITNTNSFGLFREYRTVSSHNPRNPDAFMDVQPTPAVPQSIGSNLAAVAPGGSGHDPLADSKNMSEDLLLAWMTTGPGNTPAGMNDLVHNVIRRPDFHPSELEDFNAVTATRRFEREQFSKPGAALKVGDGWKEGSVSIRVPCTGVRQKEEEAPEFVVNGILYRDAVEVITAELKDPDAFENIHLTPYKEWWRPDPAEEPVRVYSEIYNSDAMLQADKEMRDNLAGEARESELDDLETFIISALLYSDGTHLAAFGDASLWPVYLFLGNISKYIRLKPTSFSAHHIAYIPTVRHHQFWPLVQSDGPDLTKPQQLPDTIKEFYRKHYGKDPNADMLAHLGRELIHGVLRLILGGSFADAHKNSRCVKCGDGVLRHWLLRLLLHSADYKEKYVSRFLLMNRSPDSCPGLP